MVGYFDIIIWSKSETINIKTHNVDDMW